MATQIVELTGDEVKLLKSLDKVIQKQVEYENRLKETGREGKKAGDEVAGSFENSGKASEKAMQNYLRELRKIGPEGRKGAEALEQHLRATGQAGYKSMDTVLEQIREIDPEAADAAAAAQRAFTTQTNNTEREYRDLLSQMRSMGPEGKKAADQIEREMVAAGKLSERSIGGVIDKLAEIDPEAAEAARAVVSELKSVESQGESTFTGLKQSITSYVASFTAVTAAVAGIRELWQQVNEEQEKALSAIQSTEEADRRILQVSTADEFRQRTNTADQLAAEFGIDRSTVRNVQFSAISEGFEEDLRTVLSANQVIAPEAAASVAGQVPTLFAGQGLTTQQALSGGLAAASRSRVDFEELNQALPKVAAEANQLSGSYEQAIAALAVSASNFASVDTAADRIKAFYSKLALSGDFEGLDLVESLERLQGDDDETIAARGNLLGESQELNAAFNVLVKNLDKIRSEADAIRQDREATRGGGGFLRERVATAESDPRLRALAEERRSQVRLELAEALGGERAVDASVASRQVEEEFLDEESLGTRIAGRLAGPIAADLAVEAGASQETAESAARVAGRAFSVGPSSITAGGGRGIGGGILALLGGGVEDAASTNTLQSQGSESAAALEAIRQQNERALAMQEEQLRLSRDNAARPQPVPGPVTPALSSQQP